MSERDPRVDPQPGDAVSFGPQWQYERYDVVEASKDLVGYRLRPGGITLYCALRDWRRWSAGGEVITRAEDAQR